MAHCVGFDVFVKEVSIGVVSTEGTVAALARRQWHLNFPQNVECALWSGQFTRLILSMPERVFLRIGLGWCIPVRNAASSRCRRCL